MNKFYLFVAVAAAFVALPLTAGRMAAAAQAGDPDRGFETFMRVGCFQCHGTVGQGPISGPKLAPDPLPLEALRAYIGTEIRNPDIQYAMLARSLGCEGIDQITDPTDLAPAIRRGIEIVKAGGICLIDVHMQGR